MKRLVFFVFMWLAAFAGGFWLLPPAAAQTTSIADMQRELENLDRQEAALVAWLTDVENIIRETGGRERGTIYTPDYIEAMLRSLAAVREKRLATTRAMESQRRAGAPPD